MGHDIEDFEADVIRRSYEVPVLVDFWAEWCGPCKIIGPILEKLARQNESQWVLAKLDTQKYPDVAAQFAIRSIPSVKLFIDGHVSDEFVGALPENRILEWLDNALPSKYRLQFEKVEQLLFENKISDALGILDPIVADDPCNDEVRVLIARASLVSDPQRALNSVRGVVSPQFFEVVEAVKTLVSMFEFTNDSQSLPQDSVRPQYLDAITEMRTGNFESALDGFFGVIRRNRHFNDDGSRKACVAIFKILGDHHEVTKAKRPVLSSVLY